MSACDPFQELYEAYALRVLDAEERAALEAHLRTSCEDCARKLQEARWLVSQLAYLAPEAEPSAMLKARLMQVVRADAAQAKTCQPRRGSVPWWMWAGLAALVLLSVYSVQDSRRIENELRLARKQATLVMREREEIRKKLALAERERGIVMDQASVQIAMPAVSKNVPAMRAYWHAHLGIVVAGANIPAPPSNRALQLWLIPREPGSKPLSAGLLEQRPDGSCVGLVPEPQVMMSDTKALAITEEPAGGSAQPTSAPRWVGGIS